MTDKREKSPGKSLSRRDFLKLAFLGGAATVLRSDNSVHNEPITRENIDERVVDLLSPEQLKELGIEIYNTPDVSLHVREGIFNFPIFKDLKEGKLDGVRFVLVDHDNLSWKTSESMPEIAKDFMQAFVETPRDWSEEMWNVTIENSKIDMMNYQAQAKYYLEKEQWYIDTQKALGMSLEDPSFLNLLDSNRNMYNIYNDLAVTAQARVEAINGDREKAIEYLIEDDYKHGGIIGWFWDLQNVFKTHQAGDFEEPTRTRAREFFDKYPNLQNEVFIYLAVGGYYKPNLADSFVNPDERHSLSTCMIDYLQDRDVDCYIVSDDTPGFTLRHELFHYNSKERGNLTPEARTDWMAFRSLRDSWKAYKEGGDSKAYPFVFVVPGGAVFTEKKPNNSQV